MNTIAVPATLAAGTESRFTGGMNGEGSGQTRQDSGQGGRGDGQGPIPTAADRVDEISTYMGLNGVGESGSLLDGLHLPCLCSPLRPFLSHSTSGMLKTSASFVLASKASST